MVPKRNSDGFTLIEMMVVVTIIALMALVAIPNAPAMIRSQRMSSARNLIKNALGQAQAWAASHHVKAGLRFQFDKDGWETGRQYLVLIENYPAGTDLYRAIPNVKPALLPNGVGVIDMNMIDPANEAWSNDNLLDDPTTPYSMLGSTTFSIIFAPSGEITRVKVVVAARDEKDNVFGSVAQVNTEALPHQPQPPFLYHDIESNSWNGFTAADEGPDWTKGGEYSSRGLYMFTTGAMKSLRDPALRYTELIGRYRSLNTVQRIVLNIYSGMIIPDKDLPPD